MARVFPGGTATDVITTQPSYNSDVVMSMALWVYRTGSGGNSLGRFAVKNTTTALDYSLFVGSTTLQFETDYSTTDGKWSVPWGAGRDNSWQHVAVTYNRSSTANVPTIYINGVAQTLSTTASPAGTPVSSNSSWLIGNNPPATRVFQGSIAEFAVWAKILTASQIAALAQGYSPLFFIGGTRVYAPLSDITGRLNLRAGGSTVTGTTMGTHPKIIYPNSIQSFYGNTSAPTSNASVPSISLPLSIGAISTATTGLANTSAILLPLTISAATTVQSVNLAIPSIALPLVVGAITTANTANATTSSISLPLTIGAVTTSATSLLRPGAVSLGLTIGTVNSFVQAKPSTTNINIAIGAIGSAVLANTSVVSLGLAFGGANAQGSTGLDSFYIDCGSAVDYVDTNARTWVADAYATGGSMATTPNATSGTPDSMLYQSVRIGSAFSYAFPIRNDTYNVTLHFVEPASWAGVGARKFHIDAEGSRVYTDFDISARAGGINIATTCTFSTVVSDGELNIAFTQGNNPALVSAIQIESASVPLQARPPSIPLPLAINSLVGQGVATPPSISLPLNIGAIIAASNGSLSIPNISIGLLVGSISTNTTALIKPNSISLPLTISSLVVQSQGAITPPVVLLPLSIGAIVATTGVSIPNIGIGLLVSNVGTKTTALVYPGSANIGLAVSSFGVKTTAFVSPSSILLALTLGQINTGSIGVIPVTYGGMSNVRLKNRVIDIIPIAGRSKVENIGGKIGRAHV